MPSLAFRGPYVESVAVAGGCFFVGEWVGGSARRSKEEAQGAEGPVATLRGT